MFQSMALFQVIIISNKDCWSVILTRKDDGSANDESVDSKEHDITGYAVIPAQALQ